MKHPHLIRLDRVASELNVWLFAIAIGLGVLDFTVLVVKGMSPLPTPPASFSADRPGTAVAQPALSKIPESRG
jgi:hypothetical protein